MTAMRRDDPTPPELYFGGNGLWASVDADDVHQGDEWVCQDGDRDEGFDPVIVRSVD
ncbi:MAG TPA: hypothetical protein VGP03_08290 [Pseudonocardiaceae bacterium]|jgi:hypothetical protein|nr:hypothetical protein [Pseudonocardiaceae bacterium]